MCENGTLGFNLTLEMLIVDRRRRLREDLPVLGSFNLTLEMLIVDRRGVGSVQLQLLPFQSHT